MLRFALFDLDNTLYPQESGVMRAIGNRINQYMVERLGYSPETVHDSRDQYLQAFGTTLSALRHRYGIDALEFLDYVHDIPLEFYLRPDPELSGMLERMPLRKIIFTNADAPHARRVLDSLGVARHFERIVDIIALDFVNKPDLRAYARVLELIGARPGECLLIEDSIPNLLPAREMGMATVLVAEGKRPPVADCHIARITDLEAALTGILCTRTPGDLMLREGESGANM